MYALWHKLFCVAVFFCAVAITAEGKRPFWIIAHMINDRKHIDQSLSNGANAIEADVKYDSSGNPEAFYHGFPCDLLRWCMDWSEIPPYLESVRERTTPGNGNYNPAFALMMFDHKLGAVNKGALENAGKLFAGHVIKLYSTPSKLRVVMSIPKINQKKFILGFRNELLAKNPDLVQNFGYEFSEEKKTSPTAIKEAFESVGVKEPYIWLSHGYFNGYIFDIDFNHLLPYRDQPGLRFANKVYGWTADRQSTLRKWVEYGLDAIITNYPNKLRAVLKGFWKSHRLATQDDNPFEWIPTPTSPPPFYTWYDCSFNWRRLGWYCHKSCSSISYCWIDANCGKSAEVCYQDKPCRDKEEEQKCRSNQT